MHRELVMSGTGHRPAETWVVAATGLLGLAMAYVLAAGNTLVALAALVGLAVVLATAVRPTVGLVLLVAAMLLSPEFGQRTAIGRGGAGVTIRLDDLLCVVVGLAWLLRQAGRRQPGFFVRTELNRPLFSYFFVCLVATALGVVSGDVRPVRAFFYLLKYFEYWFIYFMLVNHLEDRRQAVLYTVVLLATCFAVDLVGLAQIPSGERVTAPFEGQQGEPNTLGGYLLLLFAVAMGLAGEYEKPALRLSLWALAGLNLVVLLFTRSRGSYLGFAVMFLVLVVLSRRQRLFLLSVAMVAALLAPVVTPQVVKDRLLYTFTAQRTTHITVGRVDLDPSTSARLRGLQQGLTRVVSRPLLGFGVTGYGFVDCQYLLLLVESGVAGLLTFLWIGVTLVQVARRRMTTAGDPLYRGLAVGLLAGGAGLVVHGLAANTFIIVRIMEPFCFLAGLVVAAPGPVTESRRLETA